MQYHPVLCSYWIGESWGGWGGLLSSEVMGLLTEWELTIFLVSSTERRSTAEVVMLAMEVMAGHPDTLSTQGAGCVKPIEKLVQLISKVFCATAAYHPYHPIPYLLYGSAWFWPQSSPCECSWPLSFVSKPGNVLWEMYPTSHRELFVLLHLTDSLVPLLNPCT